ncbi:signal peptidase I [Catenulispora sp. MAP12-49]|uniref:S26 family signal peptidase n=1 Tax=Catenulispora sp. MAP12-49 TaxID=3156302 RepID=UPI0035190C15
MIRAAIGAGVSLLAACSAVAVVRHRYTVIQVEGTSMAPTFADGDRLLVRRTRLDAVGRGEVVVFRTPPDYRAAPDTPPWLVKRAVAIYGDGVPADMRAAVGESTEVPAARLMVRGDNPRSLDSRNFGYVTTDGFRGVVVRRFGRSESC